MSRRSSEASMPDMMCLRDRPPLFSPGAIGMKTLVATTTSSRRNIFPSSRPGPAPPCPAEVRVRGVKEGDPAVGRRLDDRLGGVLVEHPRPVAVVAEAHHA